MLSDDYQRTPAVFLAHGYVGEILGKTVHGVLMHSRVFDVVALVDRHKAGQDTARICPGVTRSVPIHAALEEALAYAPKVLILAGGPAKDDLDCIRVCLRRGMDVVNSSFVFLRDVPELVSLAKETGSRLVDLRDVGRSGRDADGSILGIRAKVVYVMGTDCGLGKRTAAWEMVQEAKSRGLRAAFAATGQTGQMIGCDGGIVFDAIPTNFAAGAVEELLVGIDRKGFDLIFLEGQASLMHYAYSSSIALLHAGNPHAIVLVHDPRRRSHAAMGESPIFRMCELEDEIGIIERLSLPGGNPFRVVALATIGEECVKELSRQSPLPVADARKPGGAALLLDAVLSHLAREYR
jgi:uncharacterized NAD-dependent epimerase/dehydratase family protein